MSLSATFDADNAVVHLVASTWGATVAYAVVDRFDGEATTPTLVRGGANYPIATGQTLVLDDREFPAGVDLHYRVRAYTAAGVEVPTYSYTATVTLPEVDQVWLRAPLLPFLDRPVTVIGFGEVERPARGAVLEILSRRLPIALTDVRGSRRYNLTLRAADLAEREDLETFLSFGSVVYLLVPDGCAVPASGYFQVGDLTVARAGRQAPEGRVWYLTLPLVEVAAPDYAVLGSTITWAGVQGGWATWGAVLADTDVATWLALGQYVSAPEDEVVG